MRPSPNSPLVVAVVVLAGLFAIGALVPRDPDFDAFFGVEAWRAPGLSALLISLGLLLALLVVPGAAERVGAGLARATGLVPARLRLPLLMLATGIAFWYLPTARLSGDAGVTLIRAALGETYASNPLTCWIQSGVVRGFGLHPAEAVRLVSVLSGVLFVYTSARIGEQLFPGEPAGKGLAGLLMTCGTVAVFFGSIEVYAPPAAALALYLLLGIRRARGAGSIFGPALVLGVGFCLHGSAGLLLPSLAFLANGCRLRPLRARRVASAAVLFLLPVLVVYGALFFVSWAGELPETGMDRYGSFLGGAGLGPVLPLTKTPVNVLNRYALLDLEHFVGVLNLLLLSAPVGLLLLFFSRRPKGDSVFRFASVATVFLVLFPFFWNANFSLRFDWDLFSLMGVPLTLLGALAWFNGRRGTGSAVRAVALSLFCLVPIVITNLGTTFEQKRCAMRCRSAMRGALFRSGDADREVLDRVQRALDHYDAVVRRLDPDDTEGRTRRGWAEAKADHLRRAETEFRRVLVDEPEHTDAMEGLGFVLAQLGEIEEARGNLLAAVTADPWRLPARMHLARIDLHQGNPAAAIDHLEKGLRRGCTHFACAPGISLLVRLREDSGDREIAAELDRRAAAHGFGSR